MSLAIGFTKDQINTQYAPLAVLSALYQANHILKPLTQVEIPMKTRDFSPTDKLIQVLLSILAGCETLSEVNPRLKSEAFLASIWDWPRFADQSNLSRTLDALTLKQIDPLRRNITAIWLPRSRVRAHDWRGYLWLDFDLSGLPCSARAQESQKGYFSDKKTPLDASWHGLAPSDTAKQSGQMSSQATVTRLIAFGQRSKRQKML
jgi:hypothetical protein